MTKGPRDTVLPLLLGSLIHFLRFKTLGKRIPNPNDSDYFDPYENSNWKSTPWYNRIIHRFLYFITGPKFVVPILGFVIKKISVTNKGTRGTVLHVSIESTR